ncbi:MAG: hypothetical protein P4L51_22350 [Puia sp.]|nr:hypothetical protein [Puia sp.]
MKPILSILSLVLLSGNATYATKNPASLYTQRSEKSRAGINEKLLQLFKTTFPDAQDVQWQELPERYTVKFKTAGLATTIDYDKDGKFISSVRYYSESNLPLNILCKVHSKYQDKKILSVIEKATETDAEYFIRMEDANNLVTVRSDNEGNLSVVEKSKKDS